MVVMPVLLYEAGTWAVTRRDLRRLHAFQMKYLRDIVGVTLLNKRRNEDILAETGEVPVEDQVKLRRLQWFGHFLRMPDASRRARRGSLEEPHSTGKTSSTETSVQD